MKLDITKDIRQAVIFYNEETGQFIFRAELVGDRFLMFKVNREDAGPMMDDLIKKMA